MRYEYKCNSCEDIQIEDMSISEKEVTKIECKRCRIPMKQLISAGLGPNSSWSNWK